MLAKESKITVIVFLFMSCNFVLIDFRLQNYKEVVSIVRHKCYKTMKKQIANVRFAYSLFRR